MRFFFHLSPLLATATILRHIRLSRCQTRTSVIYSAFSLSHLFSLFYRNRKVKTPQLPPTKRGPQWNPFIQSLFTIASIVASANACIALDATYSSDTRAIKETVIENEIQACTLTSTVDRDPASKATHRQFARTSAPLATGIIMDAHTNFKFESTNLISLIQNIKLLQKCFAR